MSLITWIFFTTVEVIILRLNRRGHAVFRLLYQDFRITQQLVIRKSMTCCMCMWMGVYLQCSAEDIWGCLNSVSATTKKWLVVLHYNNECGTLAFVAIFQKKIRGLHKTQRIIDTLWEFPPCLIHGILALADIDTARDETARAPYSAMSA